MTKEEEEGREEEGCCNVLAFFMLIILTEHNWTLWRFSPVALSWPLSSSPHIGTDYWYSVKKTTDLIKKCCGGGSVEGSSGDGERGVKVS